MVPGKDHAEREQAPRDGFPAVGTYVLFNSTIEDCCALWIAGAAPERSQLPPPPTDRIDVSPAHFRRSAGACGRLPADDAARRRARAAARRTSPGPRRHPAARAAGRVPAGSAIVTVACVCAPNVAPPVGDASPSVTSRPLPFSRQAGSRPAPLVSLVVLERYYDVAPCISSGPDWRSPGQASRSARHAHRHAYDARRVRVTIDGEVGRIVLLHCRLAGLDGQQSGGIAFPGDFNRGPVCPEACTTFRALERQLEVLRRFRLVSDAIGTTIWRSLSSPSAHVRRPAIAV